MDWTTCIEEKLGRGTNWSYLKFAYLYSKFIISYNLWIFIHLLIYCPLAYYVYRDTENIAIFNGCESIIHLTIFISRKAKGAKPE